jgi:hypothetical protein
MLGLLSRHDCFLQFFLYEKAGASEFRVSLPAGRFKVNLGSRNNFCPLPSAFCLLFFRTEKKAFLKMLDLLFIRLAQKNAS